MDLVYRINPRRRTNIRERPREIIIKFTKRKVRDVLRLLEDKRREDQDKEVITLREILWKVRQKRLPYKELAAALRRVNIKYRWQIPKGIVFIYKTKRQNINSIMKAEEFICR